MWGARLGPKVRCRMGVRALQLRTAAVPVGRKEGDIGELENERAGQGLTRLVAQKKRSRRTRGLVSQRRRSNVIVGKLHDSRAR